MLSFLFLALYGLIGIFGLILKSLVPSIFDLGYYLSLIIDFNFYNDCIFFLSCDLGFSIVFVDLLILVYYFVYLFFIRSFYFYPFFNLSLYFSNEVSIVFLSFYF